MPTVWVRLWRRINTQPQPVPVVGENKDQIDRRQSQHSDQDSRHKKKGRSCGWQQLRPSKSSIFLLISIVLRASAQRVRFLSRQSVLIRTVVFLQRCVSRLRKHRRPGLSGSGVRPLPVPGMSKTLGQANRRHIQRTRCEFVIYKKSRSLKGSARLRPSSVLVEETTHSRAFCHLGNSPRISTRTEFTLPGFVKSVD